MKTIIAGSRGIANSHIVATAIADSGFDVTEVVSGRARGVDSLGERWAHQTGKPVSTFPADWERYGKSAGCIRNTHMANYADALIAVWDGKSSGTKHMIDTMKRLAKPVYVATVTTGASGGVV